MPDADNSDATKRYAVVCGRRGLALEKRSPELLLDSLLARYFTWIRGSPVRADQH